MTPGVTLLVRAWRHDAVDRWCCESCAGRRASRCASATKTPRPSWRYWACCSLPRPCLVGKVLLADAPTKERPWSCVSVKDGEVVDEACRASRCVPPLCNRETSYEQSRSAVLKESRRECEDDDGQEDSSVTLPPPNLCHSGYISTRRGLGQKAGRSSFSAALRLRISDQPHWLNQKKKTIAAHPVGFGTPWICNNRCRRTYAHIVALRCGDRVLIGMHDQQPARQHR